ncbi:hypothetical protein TSH64_31475 [Azospirillum sp. TSH64]|nr:hypothetical protein TSH64_31475 [Azospirillum sp. TSH64]
MRRILSLAARSLAVSPSTRWKLLPGPISDRSEMHSLWRSSDFGVNRTSGLRKLRRIWRRKTWNRLAGVVTLQICQLSSAHICRKRSGRADECSGPWPS